jgi:hypothetical protein
MKVAQILEAAKAGASLKEVSVPTLTHEYINSKALFSVADAIRKVGREFVILSTDMGQVGFPPPPNGMAAYIAELRAQGFRWRCPVHYPAIPLKVTLLSEVSAATGR